MNNKILLFFFIVLTPVIVKAQLKEIKLINSETSEAIEKASIFLIEENNGTVSNDEGIAKLGNTKSKQIRISHLNYDPLVINVVDLKQEITTLKLKPKTAHQIEEVVITAGFDQLLVGKWKLKEISNIIIFNNGDEDIKLRKIRNGNMKEYFSDRTFIIHNSNGYKLLNGTFIALNNQIHENIIYSLDRSIQGITNILFYSKTEKRNQIRVKYQLPGARSITEEIWERM